MFSSGGITSSDIDGQITHISWLHRCNFGGVERRAHEIAMRLGHRGFSTEMICADTLAGCGGGRLGAYDERTIRIICDPYRFGLKDIWERYFIDAATRRLAGSDDASLVHGQGVNGLPGIRNDIPTVICWHGAGADQLDMDGTLGDYWRETTFGADRILAISNQVKSDLVEKGVCVLIRSL